MTVDLIQFVKDMRAEVDPEKGLPELSLLETLLENMTKCQTQEEKVRKKVLIEALLKDDSTGLIKYTINKIKEAI